MKTEKEKAIAGELYDANNDSSLIHDRLTCKESVFQYNNCKPSEIEKKTHIIKSLFKSSGENFIIEAPFYCDYGYNIEIGDNFYANVNCVILDGASVKFGNNVFIAPGCGFYTAGHPLDITQRNKGLEYAKPIIIGNNVWIGAQCIILPGVNIGDNTTIGAGSVVTKDIPSNVLAYGNPCRVIKEI